MAFITDNMIETFEPNPFLVFQINKIKYGIISPPILWNFVQNFHIFKWLQIGIRSLLILLTNVETWLCPSYATVGIHCLLPTTLPTNMEYSNLLGWSFATYTHNPPFSLVRADVFVHLGLGLSWTLKKVSTTTHPPTTHHHKLLEQF